MQIRDIEYSQYAVDNYWCTIWLITNSNQLEFVVSSDSEKHWNVSGVYTSYKFATFDDAYKFLVKKLNNENS